MATLTQCNREWSSRPAEERFTSLLSMRDHFAHQRSISRAATVPSHKLRAVPTGDRELVIEGPNGHGYAPTHWAFGQTAALTSAPASYLRSLPAPLAADCLNYGLQVERESQDVQVLLTKNGESTLRAMTGPRYGRIWNGDVVSALIDRFGDGVTGNFRVPGEFGQAVDVTTDNTTLFAGDRDMFVFLADETNRIELPNRRDGTTGALARGFFVSNSEVGASTLRVKTFLFDYVCCNRIVWGAHELEEISIRHTSSAPDRFVEEVSPALLAFANSTASNVERVLVGAQRTKLDKTAEFLAKRFGPRIGQRIAAVHEQEEGRPIETLWDCVTGATAYAKSIPWTGERVDFETIAGNLLDEADLDLAPIRLI